ncbi:MAG: RNA-directed DNA polymerase [archaeon]
MTFLTDSGQTTDVIRGYVFKADICHYFERVDHNVLLSIIARRIQDDDVLWLVKKILDNYESKETGKGMPLGNWTSQFFANIYLNELDQYVKHDLKVKYYIRYVDDFVILHQSERTLKEYEAKIRQFLTGIKLDLHPTKCSITPLHRGTSFLGYRIFSHHKLPRKRNSYKIQNKLTDLLEGYENCLVDADHVLNSLQGWSAYAKHANSHNFREQLRRRTIAGLVSGNKKRELLQKRNNQ